MSKAIVTLLIDDQHQHLWDVHARASWEIYARRHGFKLVTHTQAIDTTDEANERSLAWQKLLIFRLPELQDCERVVWVDTDVIINAEVAPDITLAVPPDKIGVAVAHLLLAYPGLENALQRVCGTESLAEHARHYYEQNSLPAFDYFLN